MDKTMQLSYDKANNKKTDDGLSTKLNIGIFDETAYNTPVSSMLPISVPNLTVHPNIAKEIQSKFENICHKKIENRHCTIHNTEMFDEKKHDTPVSSTLPSLISNFTTHSQTVTADNMQLSLENNNDQEMEQFHSTKQNTEMYEIEAIDTPTFRTSSFLVDHLITDIDTDIELFNEKIIEDNNEKINQNCSTLQNAVTLNRTNRLDTSKSSMLPSAVPNLTTQSNAELPLGYVDEQIKHLTLQNIGTIHGIVYDTSNYSTLNYQSNASSDMYSKEISENVANKMYLNTDPTTLNNQYQLITINKINQAITTPTPLMVTNNISISDSNKAPLNHEIASIKQFIPNKTQTVMEFQPWKHITEKNLMSTSTPDILNYLPGKKHDKMDSDSHPVNKFKFLCKDCTKSFTCQALLERHIRIHTGERPFKCKDCDKSFNQKATLQRHHINIHTGDKSFNCKYCNKSFSQKSNLQTHIRIHTGDELFECEYCKKSFSQKDNLQTHIQIHTGDKRFKCEYCNKSFYQKAFLQRHINIHTGDKHFKCKYCNKGFSQKSNLQTHIRIHTGDKHFKCEYCNKSFSQKSHLQTHIRIHTGDKLFECEYCKKSFSQKGNLQTHIQIHTGDKRFKCEYCNKSFYQKAILQTHIRIHTGDKFFKCEYCNKSFSQKSNLQTHIRIHTGDKHFKCEYCKKSFNRKDTLQRHNKIYTGDKLFNCEYCNKSFSRNGHLITHIRIHIGDKPYTCRACPIKFARKDYLEKHKKINTKIYQCDN